MVRPDRRPPRSYLYVPGNAPDRMPKARASAAEAVIVDLEDAVPLAEKAAARESAAAFLGSLDRTAQEVWVRLNPGPAGLEDLEAVLACGAVDGLVLAKARAEDVATVSAVLDAHALPWMLSPLIETPAAVMDVRALAAGPRVQFLQIGEYDLCAEVGVVAGPDEQETAWTRAQVVMAGAEAGLDPAVAPVSTVIRDTEQLAASTARARRQGFVGRACIHPAQLAVVHDVFTPTRAETDSARSMVDLLEQARETGSAVVVDRDGRLVDPATVRAARRTLALTRAPRVPA